jgi:hypothetical protein|tara:strand:- start:1096 stop:1233 length:138 start_codon:yes stop_codon:yes gene_type:complete
LAVSAKLTLAIKYPEAGGFKRYTSPHIALGVLYRSSNASMTAAPD